MNLNIAICDDDAIIAEDIKNKLSAYRNNYQIDTYESGIKLLKKQAEYDLIFLDIEMPEMSGMEVASELRKTDFKGHLVFLTNHTEFMPEAFKVKAFRFLIKPINDDALKETIVEFEKEILNNKKLVINSTDGIKFLYLNDIICFETIKCHTYLYTKNGDIETRKSLHEWMETLGTEHFIQVHKSFGIALQYIDTIESNFIIMKYTQMKVPVSRRKISTVKKAFFEYVKKYAVFT